MKTLIFIKTTIFTGCLLSLFACDQNSNPGTHSAQNNQFSSSPTPPASPATQSQILDSAQLKALGFRLPNGQNIGDILPPQPSTHLFGKVVKGGPGRDTNWTAFTLVLFLDQNGQYEVLTQKRAIRPIGAIETPGGHLTGGQTWGAGASTELQQEAGILVNSSDLFYLSGGDPRLSNTGNLYGNANFFVVFTGTKPSTANHSNEVDKSYGHRWLPLGTVYKKVKAEQNAHPAFGTGKYYDFFRGHLIDFVENVLPFVP